MIHSHVDGRPPRHNDAMIHSHMTNHPFENPKPEHVLKHPLPEAFQHWLRGHAKVWESIIPTRGVTPKRGSPSSQLEGLRQSMTSNTPTQGATPTRGSPSPQLEGPGQSMGVSQPNSRRQNQQWPTRGQIGCITPAVWRVPGASERGRVFFCFLGANCILFKKRCNSRFYFFKKKA